jgi:hypothetical protein
MADVNKYTEFRGGRKGRGRYTSKILETVGKEQVGEQEGKQEYLRRKLEG